MGNIMERCCEWRFVSNQNSGLTGINDAGIETFSAEILSSLVRESIQNSLDAKNESSVEPVVVDLSMFDIPQCDFPGGTSFQSALDKCLQSNLDEPQAKEFFSQAINLFQSPIKVMRISDHNTIGLRGADNCKKGTAWSRLVKESGSSNKEGDSGGSFGIGKSAAFACSKLRCIIYSSVDDSLSPVQSTIGVARLISFEQPNGDWTTGTGYYSEDDRFVAIPTAISLDPSYRRTDSGTDIYILGSSIDESSMNEIIHSVLINFIVSIVKGKLIVRVQETVLDKNTIGAHISKINPYDKDTRLSAVVYYYHLLSSNDPSIVRIPLKAAEYGSKYGFKDGDCTLYLMEGENLNRRILMTRSAGMSLFEQDRFSSSIHFTGLLMIEGKQMNSVFKQMEVPSHDAWKPSRCGKDEKEYTAIFSDLKRYLKSKVLESFGRTPDVEIDAFGAGDFLPDDTQRHLDAGKKQAPGLIERIRQITGKEVTPRPRALRPVKIKESPATENPQKSDRKKHTPKKDLRKPAPNFKSTAIQPRAICTDATAGKYTVKFIVPKKAKHGRLEFRLSGEQSDYDVPVSCASLTGTTKSSIIDCKENYIILENLNAGEILTLKAILDFDSYCMLEVLYYESKK